MNATQYEEFMESVQAVDESCKYGHFGCSNVEGGQCCDELYSNLSSRDRAIVNGDYDAHA